MTNYGFLIYPVLTIKPISYDSFIIYPSLKRVKIHVSTVSITRLTIKVLFR